MEWAWAEEEVSEDDNRKEITDLEHMELRTQLQKRENLKDLEKEVV